MKKQIFKSTVLGSVILISTQIVAQKKNETSAAVAYKNTYSLAMGKNNIEGAKKALLDAKTYVDLAAENSETQNSPKTLWLKGEIYSNLFLFGNNTGDSVLIKEENNLLTNSISAFKTGFDSHEKFDGDIKESIYKIHSGLENISRDLYEASNFKDAARFFNRQAEFLSIINVLDSNSLFNAALCYERVNDLTKASENYKKLAEFGYKSNLNYALTVSCLRRNNQLEEAKSTINFARQKYPQDKDVLLEAVNVYLALSDAVGAEALLNEAISKDPNNVILHVTIGAIYVDLKQNEKAEAAFTKALAIDAENEDALYQLGAHLVNWAKEIADESNQLNYKDPRVAELDKKSSEIFSKAIIPLEKYAAKQPSDKQVLTILSQLYRNIGNIEKSNEYREKAK
jgi:tetratricopeptide (TPR) repeat protein